MGAYELKFKKKRIYLITGVVWLFNTIIFSAFFIFSIYWFGGYFITVIASVGIIASLFNGIYFIRLSSRTYIKITESEIVIHKGMVWGSEVIKFEDMDEVRLLGDRMFIMLREGHKRKEFEIKLDLLYMKDLDILLEKNSLNNIQIKRI